MSSTLEPQQLTAHLQFLHAYLECSDGIQEVVSDMLKILFGEESTEDEKLMASNTISEALFPQYENDGYGMNLEELVANLSAMEPSVSDVLEALNREEDEFATRLSTLLKLKGVNQSELADMIGVTQPAVSLMINRNCRPQKSTVEKIAEALEVECTDLWVDYS